MDGPAEFDIIPLNAMEPPGWRWVNYDEAHDFLEDIQPMLPEWGIVALQDGGKMDGPGYGGGIHQTRGPEAGQKLIMIGGFDEEEFPHGSWMDSARPGSYYMEGDILIAELGDAYGGFCHAEIHVIPGHTYHNRNG